MISKSHNILQFEFTDFGNQIDYLRKANNRLIDSQLEGAEKPKMEGNGLREIAIIMDIHY